ncbi:mitochondrial carrier [Xylona heveae TC161]|uniref:Mitochondrial carrier n=1 Tax=Xylona heveae (strain CBS 132557 / TC161) TaxID=1328760 RepID=A0A165J380_XYLHT|nr:mitochondrial carrier [Xylona heveae TC161]KZF25670.1 mitochondrial carrier [Xylona heveae TC161]
MSLERKEPPSGATHYVPHTPKTHVQSGDGGVSNSDSPSLITRLEILSTTVPKPYITSFCGASGGVASGIVTCPLDVIKTKLQAQGGFRGRRDASGAAVYRGMLGTARVIWREDGIRGMYRGLGPMMLGYLPTWAVYLSVYDSAREYYYTVIDNRFVARALASITAGACSTMATNPIWVIKTRLMSQGSARVGDNGVRAPWHYKSTLDAARKMYKNEGILAFYSGLTPALLGLTHVAVQFPLYEYFKKQFTGLEMGQQQENDSSNHWIGICTATFLSKVCASSATYPHEVLRTRLQTQQRSSPVQSNEGISFRGGLDRHQKFGHPPGASSSDGMINIPRYQGVIKTCKIILKEEGWRAFYTGMGTNMIRAVPAAVTTMMTYEYMQSTIHRLQAEGHRKLELMDGD